MMMLAVLVATVLARHDGAHANLRKTNPPLQNEDDFHNDFVHDDTAHPEEAVKVNIRESESRLKAAEKELEGLKDRFESASASKDAAEAAHDAHQEEVDAAKKAVKALKAEIAEAPSAEKGLEQAQEAFAKSEQAVNKTDMAATASAETVKQAQRDLHERIMDLVEAKENRSDAEAKVDKWEKRLASGKDANTTLAEATKKYNQTQIMHQKLADKMKSASDAFSSIHEDWKSLEGRVDEAQKIFDIDREQYEEYIGPYPAVPKENLWWDALADGKWHENWPHFF